MNALRALTLAGAALVAGAAFAACGGGGGGSSAAPPAPTPTPYPTLSAAPSGIPQNVNGATTNTLPTAKPTAAGATAAPAGQIATIPLALPTNSSGVVGNVGIPATASIPPSTTVDESMSSTITDAPAISGIARAPLAARSAQAQSHYPLLYIGLRFSKDVTFPQGPGLSIQFPGTLSSDQYQYFLAFYDPLRPSLGWQYGYEGPAVLGFGTSNGFAFTQINFNPDPHPISFAAFTKYYFALVAQSKAAPPPTPAPTGVPTVPPSPTPAPVVASPSALAFNAIGAANAQQVTLSEPNYSGPFVAHDQCNGAVTTAVSGSTVTVTPQAVTTACPVFVVGDRGATVQIPVTVTTNGITVVVPGATPTPTPSPAPTSLLSISPSSVSLGFGQSVTVTVSEAGYTGPITGAVVDPTIAYVTPASQSSSPATFTIVGNSQSGSSMLVFTDGNRNVGSIPIIVQNGSATISIGTPTPSPAPNTTISGPTSISVGGYRSQGFSYFESGYTGLFTVVSDAPAVLTPLGATFSSYGGSANVTFYAGRPGVAHVTVSDTNGHSAKTTYQVNPPAQAGTVTFSYGTFMPLGATSTAPPIVSANLVLSSANANAFSNYTYSAVSGLGATLPSIPGANGVVGTWTITPSHAGSVAAQPYPNAFFNSGNDFEIYSTPALDPTRVYRVAVYDSASAAWTASAGGCFQPQYPFWLNQYSNGLQCTFPNGLTLQPRTYSLAVYY